MKLDRLVASRPLAGLLTAGTAALLGVLLLSPASPSGSKLARASYDSLHRINTDSAALTNSPVVLVFLDLDSYLHEKLDPAQPWPRELHAKLVRRLTEAGARAIVFDIIFSGPASNPESDKVLAEAIRANGRVVLASELRTGSHDTGAARPKEVSYNPPYQPLREAAAAQGIAALYIDDDLVVRRAFTGFAQLDAPGLAGAAARLDKLAPERDRQALPHWLRYHGPARTIPHVSYSAALQPGDVPDEFFRDKFVFIGAQPVVGGFSDRRDEYRSPFHSWRANEILMPAVEIHATQMLNLARGDWLSRWAPESELGVLIAVALAFGFGLMWLRPLPASLVAAAGAGGFMVLAGFGFRLSVWFPWLIVSAVQIPGALFGSILFHFAEWYRTRRRMEAAKRVADAKIREQAALIDKAHDAILVQDLAGRMLYANPSAEKLYGWTLAEWQTHGVTLSDADTTRAAEARAAVESKGDWNGELRQQTKRGSNLIVEARWTLIRDEQGRPSALLMMHSDITDKKQLEAQFLRTQRMETIGSLAGGMAHDLNNALSPVLLGVQLLRRKSADEESSRILGLMESSTHRGADMVRQVLLFARGKEGDFQPFNAGAAVKEIEKMARETFPRSITIESFVAADLWPVRGNVTQFHQVLLNLCVNARDAMPGGGRLALVADNAALSPDEAAQIPGAVPGDFVSISVSDTGGGMTPEVRAKIFEPFFTTKGEGQGTGLGLATVRRIIRNHGGFLRLESQPGEGTTFEVLLPRPTAAPSKVDATRLADLPRGQGELLIVADDEEAIRELLVQGLQAQGYRVLAAGSGPETLELIQQHAKEVRLLITDSSMPGMDGAEAVAALRKLFPTLPVIVTSGSDGGTHAPGSAERLLRKPFAMEEVATMVAAMLADNGTGRL